MCYMSRLESALLSPGFRSLMNLPFPDGGAVSWETGFCCLEGYTHMPKERKTGKNQHFVDGVSVGMVRYKYVAILSLVFLTLHDSGTNRNLKGTYAYIECSPATQCSSEEIQSPRRGER